jgi:hypothetical protein
MPAYPPEQFRLLEHERAEIQALSQLIAEKSVSLGERHIWSLSNLERGNATLAAWHSWAGEDGYGIRTHAEIDELSRRLRVVIRRISERARRVLSKRIRKNPHEARKANAA